jgi:hypothetical protein
MKPMPLPAADQRRLEKLAREAGRSLRSMMRFVLRDGFDFCEWVVRESRKSQASVRKYGAIPDTMAQREARAIIAAAHARLQKKAA